MPKFLEPCRQEFQLRNCGFGNISADEIVRSQWQSRTKNVFFLAYRWLVAIFYIVTVGISMSHITSWTGFGLYMIYLTDWGILLCMFTGIFGAILVSIWYFHPEWSDQITTSGDLPMSFKVYWAFHNAAMTLSFVISIIYWGILHNDSMPLDATNVMTHACNSAIMLLDVLIVAHPIRLYHVYQPLTVGLAFMLFSVIYYAAGGTDKDGNPFIYFVLDWSKPGGAAITSVGTVALAIVVHTALFVLQKARVCVHDRCGRKQVSIGGSPTSTNSTAPTARISMVLGSGHTNSAFKGSTSDVL